MIKIIAAIGRNRELGKNNDLIWNLPNDLKFFKEKTLGQIVVMGRKTFFSLPKMLDDRTHIVLTTQEHSFPEGVIVFNNLEDLLVYIEDKDVWIIGGAMVYNTFIDYADEMYLTEIDAIDLSAEVYFPEFNKTKWEREVIDTNSDNGISYEHVLYKRIKPCGGN